MAIPFVTVRDFTPNFGQWTPIGNITSVAQTGNVFTLSLQGGRALQLSFLSSTCFRVRFNPQPGTNYAIESSIAVVNRNLGTVSLAIAKNDAQALVVDTGSLVVRVDLQPYRIQVFRNGQLISADEPSYNLVYIPGERVIANFKTRQNSARHFGFGEKAGSQLVKTLFTMTQFNFDNFKYVLAPLPPNNGAGPLNPSEALYTSIPFVLEINDSPSGRLPDRRMLTGSFSIIRHNHILIWDQTTTRSWMGSIILVRCLAILITISFLESIRPMCLVSIQR